MLYSHETIVPFFIGYTFEKKYKLVAYMGPNGMIDYLRRFVCRPKLKIATHATHDAVDAPGLTTTSILYFDPVNSFIVLVCPNLAPSDLKKTALLLGCIFIEIPILTICGMSPILRLRLTYDNLLMNRRIWDAGAKHL